MFTTSLVLSPDPVVNACQILDPEDRLWFYRPPPHETRLVPESRPRQRSAASIHTEHHINNLNQFHEVTNAVLKKVVLELKFQNDAFRLFIFQRGHGGEVDFETSSFLKLVLILRSMGLTASKLQDGRQTNFQKRSGHTQAMLHVVRTLNNRLLALFQDYEELKLRLESAWAIQEAVCTLRNQRAFTFFKSNLSLHDTPLRPAKLYSHVWKWLKRLISETGRMKMLVKTEQRKLREWWLVAQRMAGFVETLPSPAAERYSTLLQIARHLEIKQRTVTSGMDSVVPYIDVLRYEASMFKSMENEAAACRHYLREIKNI